MAMTRPATCCSSPVDSPDRPTSTTPTRARPWPPTVRRPGSLVINDVALTKRGAWFTDPSRPSSTSSPSPGELGEFSTLALTGPAADTERRVQPQRHPATADGKTLIVAHSGNGELYTVNPGTGASALIAGVSVPNVDGIVLQGRRLWAVQNFTNQVSRIKLGADLTQGS